MLLSAQAKLQGMKAERAALEAQRKAEAADSRKALAEIDFLQVTPALSHKRMTHPRVLCRLNRRGRGERSCVAALDRMPEFGSLICACSKLSPCPHQKKSILMMFCKEPRKFQSIKNQS